MKCQWCSFEFKERRDENGKLIGGVSFGGAYLIPVPCPSCGNNQDLNSLTP